MSRDLGQKLEYSWRPQRRAFVRNTINADVCDLIIGVPSSFERTRATIPYYRSTYVFLTKKGGPKIQSFDDPILRKLRIGVQLIGDDYSNAPPAQALANRGIIHNVHGYSVYGDYALPNPPARIVDAVASGEVDVAVVWGPLAGYFAPRAAVPLVLTPVTPQIDLPYLPFVFDISMGVKRGNDSLRERLDSVIVKRSVEIRKILDDYGVPRA